MTPPLPGAIPDAYGLGGSEVAEARPEGRMWIVDHPSGRFVIQRRTDAPPSASRLRSLRTSCRLMAHLHARGFPCPDALRRRDGEFLTVLTEGAFQVMTFIGGAPPREPISPEMAAQVGRCLGDFHRLQEGLEEAGLPGQDLRERLRAGIGRRMVEWRSWDVPRPDLLRAADEARGRIESCWARLSGLPAGLMHTDASPGNVHFDGDRLEGFVDFEVIPGPLLLDLGMAFVMWALRFDVGTEKNRLDRPCAEAFLRAYAGTRPLQRGEADALREAITLASIWWWGRQRSHRPGDPAFRLTSRGEVYRICAGLGQDWLTSSIR